MGETGKREGGREAGGMTKITSEAERGKKGGGGGLKGGMLAFCV